MIHIFLGTKAQLIKMAPIMKELQDRGLEYNFVFSGQHQETIKDLRDNFGIKEPNYILHKGEDINSVGKMFIWMIKVIITTLFNKKSIWKNDKHGIVLNHGDTFSTLLGSILAKLCGLKNAHIESGLRSFKLLHPFPEELTRLIVFRLSDYYFCPNQWAIDNLKKYNGIKINTYVNTLYDSLQTILKLPPPTDLSIPEEKFAVVSLHRFENLSKKDTLTKIVSLIQEASKHIKLLFILHNPTKKKLIGFGLYKILENTPNIELRPRYDYKNFITLVNSAEFIISDGGSNQEECYYMGKPCLLFRHATERNEGLEENIVLSKFDDQIIQEFIAHYKDYKRPFLDIKHTPSSLIVDKLITFQQ